MRYLRRELKPKKIRFFAAGEYGDATGRPHYHAAIFGHNFAMDRTLWKKTRSGYNLYTSPQLDRVWGKGFAPIGDITFDSASYVAGYVTKKITGEAAADHYAGREPEFALMSRKPGIGRAWLDKYMSDVYPSDEFISRGKSMRPPRYFDKVLEQVDPELHARIKTSRIESLDIDQVIHESTTSRQRARDVNTIARTNLRKKTL